MIIKPELWNDVPDEVNWICDGEDYKGYLLYRPEFDVDVLEWNRAEAEPDCLIKTDEDGMDAISAIIDQLNTLDGYCYRLAMRPSLFKGKFYRNDIVSIDYEGREQDYFEIISHNIEQNLLVARPSYDQTITCSFSAKLVRSINGVACNLTTPKPVGLIPETHNPEPVDGGKALDILRGMLS